MKRLLLVLWILFDIAMFAVVVACFPSKEEEKHTDPSKLLVIGDSLSAGNQWQQVLEDDLGMKVSTRAKGGLGFVQMVDGELGLDGDYKANTEALKPLSVDEVKDMDYILLYGGYNNRGRLVGSVGDRYALDGSGQGTFAGILQYAIDRIRETLGAAGNNDCQIMIVTVDCAGKYGWIDADGYEEYPVGSGQTMETLANMQIELAKHNGLAYCDLYHTSGIDRNTWKIYGKVADPVNSLYSPYELDSAGEPVNNVRIKYVTGNYYYQWRNGEVVFEEYQGVVPYPYNSDQLHKSDAGYACIGQTIANRIKEVWK